jgi:hypothetical protein
MIASISSRDRKPSIGRSKRFIGTPKACSTMCSALTSRCPANFRNARSAANLALRVRTALPRSCSRWSRKARISAGVMSCSFIVVGCLCRCAVAKSRNSTKPSR